MSNYRMSKGTTEHFTSLEEMRTAWGMKPVTKKTSDRKKLKEQQERFLSKHKCKACGTPMTYIHGNVMACKNPECKGIEIKREDKDGNEIAVGNTGTLSYHYTDNTGAAKTGDLNVTVYETEDDWKKAVKAGNMPKDGAAFIKSTGELVLGNEASETLKQNKASIELNYDKKGFNSGEVRPEYYFNCTDITDAKNKITYEKYDAKGNEIYQDIDYIIAVNQTLTVNTNASDVFNADIGRDVDEMINAVKAAIDANDKVDKIKDIYRRVIYVKAPEYRTLVVLKDRMEQYIEINSGFQKMRIQFDFNPMNL